MTEQDNLTSRTGIGKIRFACMRWLYRRGFYNEDARVLISVQFLVAAGLVVAGALLAWHTLWLLWLGVGALLAVVNFYFIVQKVLALIPNGLAIRGIVMVVLNLYLRMLITGVLLFICIGPLKASISALLIGVSLSAVSAIIFGLSKWRVLRAKEASSDV